MSKSFANRWRSERLDDLLFAIVLQDRLRGLIESPLIRQAGALLLKPLVSLATGPQAFQDRTGYEAFVNKVHIEDFLDDACGSGEDQVGMLVRQGARAAVELSRRLEGEGKYRVLLSLDSDLPTMTLRFFERREGEPWGADDPDAFQLEEVLMLDTRS